MFGSAIGANEGATNIRRRVLAPAVDFARGTITVRRAKTAAGEMANTTLATAGVEPLPEGLTPHSLRRTYASLLFAIGEGPPYVMAQLGHVDP